MSTSTSASPTRSRHRGDQRRAALLASLDALLREPGDDGARHLDSINVADISRRAGVTRSAFYFYFESKQAAVAALMDELYDEAFAASHHLLGDAPPREKVTGTIQGLFDALERHTPLFRAMLDARSQNAAVRAMWDSDRESFVAPVAELIQAERRSGRAPSGADATAVATTLLELNDRMLERLVIGGPLDRNALEPAVIEIWLRAIYGRTDS